MDDAEKKRAKQAYNDFRREQMRKSPWEYENAPNFCLFCGEMISYEKRYNRYCNSSCSASHLNRGVSRNKGMQTFCQCGKPKKRMNTYCDECTKNRVYMKSTTIDQTKCEKVRRRILIEERGHKCESCGATNWFDEPVQIQVHHKDGDSDNNTQENLILVCPNCHAYLHKKMGIVRGKSGKRQQMRRKRYKEGKTW